MPMALISYDISNNRRRNRVARFLLNYGQRVQYSVFEMIEDQSELCRVFSSLIEMIEPEEDSLRMYVLCRSCRNEIRLAGKGRAFDINEEYFVV